jgi:hypothetical protein
MHNNLCGFIMIVYLIINHMESLKEIIIYGKQQEMLL